MESKKKSRRFIALIVGAFVGVALAVAKNFFPNLSVDIAKKTIELFEVYVIGVSVRPSSKFLHKLLSKLFGKDTNGGIMTYTITTEPQIDGSYVKMEDEHDY